MNTGFIKNFELLEETSKVKDLLDFGAQCESFVKKIDSLKKASIISLVGPFGSGKSTLLHQIMTERLSQDIWVEFDAWKYPDRRDLWEGFVLDVAKSINPDSVDGVKRKIEGTQNDDKKTLVKTLSKIPGFSALEGLNHFLETSPAKRVDDVQKILKDSIESAKKDLFIIVEDIDRSGDAGVFFLETLKQFLISAQFDKKIVVIVPIAVHNYQKNIDSYLKCIDYFEFFEVPVLKLDNFVDEVFDDKLFVGEFVREKDRKIIWTGKIRKLETISFLEGLFLEMPETTMRLLKLIIRKANLIYRNQVSDGHEPDFRITLCLEAAKYYKVDEKSEISFFDDFKKRGVVTRGNLFSSFLLAVLANQDSLYRIRRTNDNEKKELVASEKDFKFIDRLNDNKISHPSYPWSYYDFDAGENFALTSFYKNY